MSTTAKNRTSSPKTIHRPNNASPELQAFFERHKVVNPNCITTKQASAYLTEISGVPTAPSSLEVYRCKNRPPKYKKVGSRCYYTVPWLNEYASGIEIKIYDPSKGCEEVAR